MTNSQPSQQALDLLAIKSNTFVAYFDLRILWNQANSFVLHALFCGLRPVHNIVIVTSQAANQPQWLLV